MKGRGEGRGDTVGKYKVSGFGGIALRPDKRPKEGGKGVLQGLLGFFKGGPRPRAPLSGADPSLVAGETVRKEDDVLYLANLPTFSQVDSESDAFSQTLSDSESDARSRNRNVSNCCPLTPFHRRYLTPNLTPFPFHRHYRRQIRRG